MFLQPLRCNSDNELGQPNMVAKFSQLKVV